MMWIIFWICFLTCKIFSSTLLSTYINYLDLVCPLATSSWLSRFFSRRLRLTLLTEKVALDISLQTVIPVYPSFRAIAAHRCSQVFASGVNFYCFVGRYYIVNMFLFYYQNLWTPFPFISCDSLKIGIKWFCRKVFSFNFYIDMSN